MLAIHLLESLAQRLLLNGSLALVFRLGGIVFGVVSMLICGTSRARPVISSMLFICGSDFLDLSSAITIRGIDSSLARSQRRILSDQRDMIAHAV